MNSRGNQLATPDAELFVTAPKFNVTCPSGTFKAPDNSCVDCWCNGVSSQCKQLENHYQRKSIGTSEQDWNAEKVGVVPKNAPSSLTSIKRNQIEHENGMIRLIDLSQYFINSAHYWRIPSGSQLLSYGGTLEWSYQYHSRYNSPTAHDDVIITSS